MFADDTDLSFTGRTSADIQYKIKKYLDNTGKWIISNKLNSTWVRRNYETGKILYGDYMLKRIKKKLLAL